MAEDRYRRLFDAAQEFVWVHRDGTILLANPFAARTVGLSSAEQMIGRSIFEFHHPDNHQRIKQRAGQAMREDRLLPPVELEIARGDGTYATIEFRAQPFADEGG